MLKIQGLHKKYGNYHALDGLDMELKDGALFGFVGPNGAGKTTAMRMLCGLSKPTSGSGRVAGFDLFTQSEEIKKNIGYI